MPSHFIVKQSNFLTFASGEEPRPRGCPLPEATRPGRPEPPSPGKSRTALGPPHRSQQLEPRYKRAENVEVEHIILSYTLSREACDI